MGWSDGRGQGRGVGGITGRKTRCSASVVDIGKGECFMTGLMMNDELKVEQSVRHRGLH